MSVTRCLIGPPGHEMINAMSECLKEDGVNASDVDAWNEIAHKEWDLRDKLMKQLIQKQKEEMENEQQASLQKG